jgi:hypothetical protein
LSVLPSQGQYASVLFGAFQILITVRVETWQWQWIPRGFWGM